MTDAAAVNIDRMPAHAAEQISSLMNEVIQSLPYYNERARREETAKYTASHLVSYVSDDPDAVLVAWQEATPIGFCVSRYDDGVVWLSWFGVAASARGLGVGTRMVRALLQTLASRGAHKLWCDTRTDNKGSQIVLERMGFARIARLDNHWYGQDFFLWEKYPD